MSDESSRTRSETGVLGAPNLRRELPRNRS
jgi:hypothetical protein